MKPIDEFKAEVSEKKQHDFDTAMSEVKNERDRFKRRYRDLLDDHKSPVPAPLLKPDRLRLQSRLS